VFAWADAASVLADEAGHPIDPIVTAVRSYGSWIRGEFDRALSLALRARQDENAIGNAPSGRVERALANILYTSGDIEAGLAETVQMMDLALESGNHSRVAHAFYMGSVAVSSIGDYDEARRRIELVQESARRTGTPTGLPRDSPPSTTTTQLSRPSTKLINWLDRLAIVG
jgi:hypothetical protein